MCERIRKWADFVRDNRDLVMTFAGIVAAGYIYVDFKNFTDRAQKIQIEQTIILKEIGMRLDNVEDRLR